MPPASASASPARRSTLGTAVLRVRWDRVARLSLLALLVLVAGLYIGPLRSLVSTWHESSAKHAQLRQLERTHKALLRQEHLLRQPTTVQAEARRLGMVRPGERSYVVRDLPGDGN